MHGELHGRAAERAAIDRLLQEATSSRSGLLLREGEPGAGKSALLHSARQQAGALGVPVVQALGEKAETELSFAGLHQLLHPLLGHLPALPEAQAAAVSAALRLGPGHAEDRVLVSVGVLTLLTEAAAGRGLLCLVDDAQWVDQPSLDALGFVARRLQAEGIVLLMARRDRGPEPTGEVWPRLVVEGLDEEAAGALLAERSGTAVDPGVVRELVGRTRGNPLALGEFGAELTADQLQGREMLPAALPLGTGVERAFLEQVRRLPAQTQTALLVAAAEEVGDLAVVTAAAARLGLDPSCLDPAEACALVSVTGERISFRHPVVRTAVYSGAGSGRRREVHRALAAVLDPEARDGRRAWHLAAATVEPDETVAAELQTAAEHARARGGHASASALLDRAARLTPETERRTRRLIAAARATWQAGRTVRTTELIDEAEALASRPADLGGLLRLRGAVELGSGVLTDAFSTLMRAAALLEQEAPVAAARCLVQAAQTASYVGSLDRFAEIGDAVGRLPAEPAEVKCTRMLLQGIAAVVAGNAVRGRELLAGGIDRARRLGDVRLEVWAGVGCLYLGQAAQAIALFHRAADVARASGHLGALPGHLDFITSQELLSGHLAHALALSDEALRLAQETGQENLAAVHLARMAMLHALRGQEEQCRAAAGAALRTALARRIGLAAATARHALAMLAMAHGEYAEALRLLDLLVAPEPGSGHPMITLFSLPDRIEAAVRAGVPDTARASLELLESWQVGAERGEARALLARSRALLAEDDEQTIVCLQEAVGLHDGSVPLERARTELYLGETLRRMRRRVDARRALRSAAEVFGQVGAEPWAERARRELRATGESARRGKAAAGEQLTPQELRIARMAAEGSSNKEIAAQLFLSPRTVEYHLYKIFPRLGVASRTELARLHYENPALFD